MMNNRSGCCWRIASNVVAVISGRLKTTYATGVFRQGSWMAAPQVTNAYQKKPWIGRDATGAADSGPDVQHG